MILGFQALSPYGDLLFPPRDPEGPLICNSINHDLQGQQTTLLMHELHACPCDEVDTIVRYTGAVQPATRMMKMFFFWGGSHFLDCWWTCCEPAVSTRDLPGKGAQCEDL